MDFSDLDSLYRHLEKIVKVSVQQVALEIEKIIKDYIKKNLYDTYTPTHYVRTYDYINSLTVSKVVQEGNVFSCMLYFDSNKIIPRETEKGLWNQHMTQDGRPTNEFIAEWIESGGSGSKYARKPIHVMENVTRELKSTKFHIQEIKKILSSNGFQITIG